MKFKQARLVTGVEILTRAVLLALESGHKKEASA